MASSAAPRDLVVLVSDRNTEYTMKGLLSRPRTLRIPVLTVDIYPHPEQDPGCLLRSHEFLAPYWNRYRHALVMLDREGSGRDHQSREVLEEELEERLNRHWNGRAAAIILDPELEIWVWSNSPHVDDVLGWKEREPDLRSWLVSKGLSSDRRAKPLRPKEAVEMALREARKPRSSALYKQLAERVSFEKCADPAFQKLLTTLRSWFPAGV